MDPQKILLADKLFRSVQMAYIHGVISLHHAPTVEQTLENYHAGFKRLASSKAEQPNERARRFMAAELPAITDILASCYDPDREAMLANLAARPELLDRMTVMSKYLAPESDGPSTVAPEGEAKPSAD